jgi:hypothetical protein
MNNELTIKDSTNDRKNDVVYFTGSSAIALWLTLLFISYKSPYVGVITIAVLTVIIITNILCIE